MPATTGMQRRDPELGGIVLRCGGGIPCAHPFHARFVMPDIGALHEASVERVAARYGLQTGTTAPLTSTQTGEPLGESSVYIGPEVDKAVSVDLQLPDHDEPSRLLYYYAFARPTALVPHLAIEWTSILRAGQKRVGLLLDLLPRLDLAVNLAYADEVYGPLTAILDDAFTIDGLEPLRILPRRVICLSPWRLSVTGPIESAEALDGIVERYLDHWMAVVSGGVGAPVDPVANDPTKLVQHDKFHRNALFEEASDPQWDRIYRLLGPNEAAELRMTLRTQEVR